MKGDFSRDTFNQARHFSAVLMQQGRVLLDADHNEQARIQLHLLRTLTRDLYGSHGGPQHGGGFKLDLRGPANQDDRWTLGIDAGHYYVDGVLCECEKCSYDQQPHLRLDGDPLFAWLKKPESRYSFQIYLDVWERHVSWVEDDSIRETALDGPDTCGRAQVIWQVRSAPLYHKHGEDRIEHWQAPPSVGTGRMAAMLDTGTTVSDAGVLPPDPSYRGAENQLYRVEIHAGSGDGGGPSFKWSRDNGSVAVPWLGVDTGDLVVPNTIGFDDCVWIELLDDDVDLAQRPGQMVRVLKVGFDRFTPDPAKLPIPHDPTRHPRVRRWDQRDNDAVKLVAGAVPILASSDPASKDTTDWIELEDGVQIRFTISGNYRSGDYWQIPARVGTGKIDWPRDPDGTASELPPSGIRHYYAPLGQLHLKDDRPTLTDERILRHPLHAVTDKPKRCCLARLWHCLKKLF